MLQGKPIPTLHLLRGRRLDAVCFVLDYVTLTFEDLVLAALAHPVVIEKSGTASSDRAGYKDALCRQIMRHVTSTSETSTKLEIGLDSEVWIVVPLDAGTPPGPEMATLSGRGHFLCSVLAPCNGELDPTLAPDTRLRPC